MPSPVGIDLTKISGCVNMLVDQKVHDRAGVLSHARTALGRETPGDVGISFARVTFLGRL